MGGLLQGSLDNPLWAPKCSLLPSLASKVFSFGELSLGNKGWGFKESETEEGGKVHNDAFSGHVSHKQQGA